MGRSVFSVRGSRVSWNVHRCRSCPWRCPDCGAVSFPATATSGMWRRCFREWRCTSARRSMRHRRRWSGSTHWCAGSWWRTIPPARIPDSQQNKRRLAMATVQPSISALDDVQHRKQLRRAVIASTVGTTIEWYDFFLYSIVTGLVFAKLYFPQSEPLTGTLQAFGIYAVGFAARPVGAAIFGHWGDRLGRKSALIATLLLMGVATFL